MIAAAALAPVVAATAFAAARGDRRVLAYLVVWAVLAAIVRAVHRRSPLPPTVLLALAAAGAVHLAGGLAPSPDPSAPTLYETWIVDGVLKYDQLAHASICAVVTIAAFHVVGRPAAALAVCWGFALGNEAFEYLSTLRFDDSYAGGFTNAAWDLAFNAAGSLAAVVWLATRPPPVPAT